MKLVRYAVVCCFCLSAHLALGAANDTLPGVPIPASPIVGTLNINNLMDIYSIKLKYGQKLIVTATYPTDGAFDIWLLPPGAPLVDETWDFSRSFQPEQTGDDQIKGRSYAVPIGLDGTYSLAIVELYGWGGTYHLEWKIVTAQPDDAIPGIPIPPSPVVRSLGGGDNNVDFLRVHLNEGQTLRISLHGPAGYEDHCFMTLFAPEDKASGQFWPWPALLGGYSGYPNEEENHYRGSYAVPPGFGGDYYVEMHQIEGSGQYRLEYEIVPATPEENIPGVPLPPSPVSGTLDGYTNPLDVYSIALKTSQTLTVMMYQPTIGGVTILPPECRNVFPYMGMNNDYVAMNGHDDQYTYGLTAPKDGVHHLIIGTGFRAVGPYRFRYWLMSVTNFSRPRYNVDWLSFYPYIYGDRQYFFDPPYDSWLMGNLYIKTLDDDKASTQSWSFNVDVPVAVVVAYSNKYGLPGWLKSWKKLADKLWASGPDGDRELYARNFPAGKITLGGNRDSGMSSGNEMYSVILLPAGTIAGLNNNATDWGRYE